MSKIRRLYYRLFKTYRRVDFKILSWNDGDALLKGTDGSNWRIAKEDETLSWPFVALEKVERV